MVVITVDASQGDTALDSGWYWIHAVKERLERTYGKLRSRRSKLPDQLIARSKRVLSAGHPDKRITHSGISILVAVTNWQSLVETSAEKRQVWSMTVMLRISVLAFGERTALLGAYQRGAFGLPRGKQRSRSPSPTEASSFEVSQIAAAFGISRSRTEAVRVSMYTIRCSDCLVIEARILPQRRIQCCRCASWLDRTP